ncbi:MAG: enolase C-terminal domain-like protein [Chloroflexota bacterium]|nr:enolase C-terminal domain-like protein [Chloroflexota bacterium]
MKITDVRAVYPKYKNVVPSWRTHFWQIVVRVETDQGIVGFGYGGGGVAAVEVVNRHFRELLLGKEIGNTEDIKKTWELLYSASLPYGRKGIAIMALSGVDLALWDLLGKAEHSPVYELIGTRNKDSARSYATGTDVEWYSELGFTAHKFPHRWTSEKDISTAISTASNARNILGQEALVMIDTYMSWSFETTLQMSESLKDFNIYWFEDVVNPDALDAQSELRKLVSPTLIAGGEHEFTEYGYQEIARTSALGLWQPDITWCGGITSGIRIVEMAHSLGIPVSPHRGGEVWGLHLIVSSNCDNLAEVLPGTRNGNKDELWVGEPVPENGYIAPTEDPGFGVEVNEMLL